MKPKAKTDSPDSQTITDMISRSHFRLTSGQNSDKILFMEIFIAPKIAITGGILFNPDLAVEEVFHVLSSTF